MHHLTHTTQASIDRPMAIYIYIYIYMPRDASTHARTHAPLEGRQLGAHGQGRLLGQRGAGHKGAGEREAGQQGDEEKGAHVSCLVVLGVFCFRVECGVEWSGGR